LASTAFFITSLEGACFYQSRNGVSGLIWFIASWFSEWRARHWPPCLVGAVVSSAHVRSRPSKAAKPLGSENQLGFNLVFVNPRVLSNPMLCLENSEKTGLSGLHLLEKKKRLLSD
jgi:hypothetical protein